MKTSLNWIKDLVPGIKDVSVQEYTDRMIMSGSKVEFSTDLKKDLDKIVVGQILKIEKHPDADKLRICQVDTGSETVQIVTGAANVKEGQKIPVVLDGGRVAGGHDGTLTDGGIKIKKGKLRGVESCGMMCSIEELGGSREMFPEAPEDGIYIFNDDVKVGDDAIKLLGMDDVIIEYEITSNRVDCFSVLGIAREAAATFKTDVNFPEVKETGNDEDVKNLVSVLIEDSDLCKRYTGRVVKNIKIEESPDWMKKRLRAHGIRPINNIVDITNYVMIEYGQPMHAYDLSTIAGNKIVVKRAKNGDKFITLDGQERSLDESILMINDGEKAIGIAGIMGGENSMITDDVKTMLFEAACFDGANIRRSAKKIGLRTDASSIFEKGLDPNNAMAAMNRACALVEELGAGEVLGGALDVYPVKKEEITLPFEPEKYNKLLGTDLSEETMLSYFPALEIKYDKETNLLHIPSFRQDLLSYADIAEEVARFFGYENIPTTLPSGASVKGGLSEEMKLSRIASNTALSRGFSQMMTYSFESPKVYEKLLMEEDDAIKISNPLGEDFSIMRTIPLNGLLTSLSLNMNRRNKDVRLFELGKIYIKKDKALKELPDEREQFTLGMYGEDANFFFMKGVINDFLINAGIIDDDNEALYSSDLKIKRPYLHPGRSAEIFVKDELLGYIGNVHPRVLKNYGIKDDIVLAVIDMPVIFKLRENAGIRKFKGISNFPASNRDISMVVLKDITAGQIEEVFKKKGGAYLEKFELFDMYEGSQITAGFKSMAYSLKFRAKDKNLSDQDVNEAMDRILKALEDLGINLRS